MFEKLYNLFINEGKDLEKVIKNAYSIMVSSYIGNKKISPNQIAESLKILNNMVENHLKDRRLELQEEMEKLDSALESLKK